MQLWSNFFTLKTCAYFAGYLSFPIPKYVCKLGFCKFILMLSSYFHISFLPILTINSTILKLAMFNSSTADKEQIFSAHIS